MLFTGAATCNFYFPCQCIFTVGFWQQIYGELYKFSLTLQTFSTKICQLWPHAELTPIMHTLLVLPPAVKKGTSQLILRLATCSNLIKESRWKFQYIRCQNVPIIFHLFEKTLGLGGISNLYGSHRITCNMNCYDYNYGVFRVSFQARWIPIGNHWVLVYVCTQC